ncbi:hypothetical protein Taro_010095 [Colocasia esculenta]|uniref:Uncharacterized protein n=1 Tax=Colocasia esculenta TaxID=4460 RepID=A0A843U6Q0_COLES|nr:hypothetical protein [Colocasia esculenta]
MVAKGRRVPMENAGAAARFLQRQWKLWYLVGLAIFTSICEYSLGTVTQMVVGQVGTLELAAVSVENSVIAGFSFGVMERTSETRIVIVNNCNESMWPAGLSIAGTPPLCTGWRERTPSSEQQERESDNLESTARPGESRGGRRRNAPSAVATAPGRSGPLLMPSKAKIEEFFAAAEKQEWQRFAQK